MRTAILAAALSLCATLSNAQTNCGNADAAYTMLAERFGESRIWAGEMHSGIISELWGNPATGTWTMLGTQGDVACVIADGVGFRLEPQGVRL